jgi:hypothetical protein
MNWKRFERQKPQHNGRQYPAVDKRTEYHDENPQATQLVT